jgi:hypothetical protein
MKEKQRELIVEIMKADEQSGLYTTRKQTAVDYLFEKLWQMPKDKFVWQHYLNKAKEMEKEQISDAYWDGIFHGNFLDGYGYYNETYGDK